MGTELGGGGLVTPRPCSSRRTACAACCAHIGLLQGPAAAPTPTRLTELGGDDYYVYASDGGLFEPLVDLGDEVRKDQPAARIHFHHTPWREPETLSSSATAWSSASASRAAASAATACSISPPIAAVNSELAGQQQTKERPHPNPPPHAGEGGEPR